MKKTLLFLSLTSSILFAGNGAELTKANCASCHMLTSPTPDMIPTLKAPAMDAVMFHIKLDITKRKDIKDFIIIYDTSDNMEGINFVKTEINKVYPECKSIEAPLTPVVGCHTGTGAVAIAYFDLT